MIIEATAVPYTESHRGGGESFPWYLSEQISKFEPTILAYAEEGVSSPTLSSYHLRLPALFPDLPPFLDRNNPLPTLKTLRGARAFLRAHSEEIDFIHVHNLRTAMSTMWLALAHQEQRRSKFRILLTDHGSRWFPFPSTTASLVDLFLPVSAASDEQLQQYATRPSWTLPVGVPPDYPGLAQDRRSFQERDIDIVFFGRFAAFKRPELFLRMASQLVKEGLPGLRAVLMGSPSDERYWSYLKREIRNSALGRHLELVLNPSTEQAAHVLGQAKLNILLSNQAGSRGTMAAGSELAPSTVLEAGACGTPTLGSMFRGAEEVIRPGITGLVVDTRQWLSVVRAAIDVLSNEVRWEELSTEVRQFVCRERTYDRIAERLHRLLMQLRQGVT